MALRTRTILSISTLVCIGLLIGPTPALAAGPRPPAVRHVGQIARQDVPTLPGSERDTLVEPDVAVSPRNPDIAVAVAHDGRYPDGGAVGIETSWTHDGGATWHHKPLPGVTATTGGKSVWARASDPVVAFGPGGSVYVSTSGVQHGCDSGVLVSRSDDGGRTFGAPRTRAPECDVCVLRRQELARRGHRRDESRIGDGCTSSGRRS
jgi:hypothetical protein